MPIRGNCLLNRGNLEVEKFNPRYSVGHRLDSGVHAQTVVDPFECPEPVIAKKAPPTSHGSASCATGWRTPSTFSEPTEDPTHAATRPLPPCDPISLLPPLRHSFLYCPASSGMLVCTSFHTLMPNPIPALRTTAIPRCPSTITTLDHCEVCINKTKIP